jgi:hypothetical protein
MDWLAPRKEYACLEHVDVELKNYVQDIESLVHKTCAETDRLLAIMERSTTNLEEYRDMLDKNLPTEVEMEA